MTGELWDPFAPNERFEALRFPLAPPSPPEAPEPPAERAAPIDDAGFFDTDDEPLADRLAAMPSPTELPWSVAPAGFTRVGVPCTQAVPDDVFIAPEALEPAEFVAPRTPEDDPAERPAPEDLIYLPGEKPPTLMAITAPRTLISRGIALAVGLHVAVLAGVLWLWHPHKPPPPPDGVVVALVMETTPTGNTAAPVPLHVPVPVARIIPPAPAKPAPPIPAPLPPPPPAPVAIKPAALPVPVPDVALPAPAAPAHTAPSLLVQGATMPVQHIGVQSVTTNRPAAPDAGNPPPYYPPVARGLGEEGQVNLSVQVLPSGMVGGVVVAQSSGYPRLDEAARESLLSWHFHAAVKNGVPVASVFTYYVRYQLQ